MNKFFARLLGDSSVTVNGKTYRGDTIAVSNGRLWVDGKKVDDLSNVQQIEVTVNGNVEELSTASGDVTVNGTAGSVVTASGDVKCGDVSGCVATTSGDVCCESVAGNVSTVSGDVTR
jgi:DUF4097 and DUF4098 domain-containing protein YvlB